MISFGPVAEAQYGDIIRWLNTPSTSFSRHSGQVHTLDTQRQFIASIQPPSRYWGLYEGTKLVGTITWMVKGNVMDVGLLVGFPSGGIATQALRQSIVLASIFGYARVTAGCHCEHTAMQKVCEKSGMHLMREEAGNRYYAYVL